jgi:hypothetical protein
MLLQYWPIPQLPQINVTVAQPAAGLPEWVKILISAGVGALFGILANVAMEYVKPRIAKRLLKKGICAQVGAELIDNLDKIESCNRLLKYAQIKSLPAQKRSVSMVKAIVCEVQRNRFDHCLKEHETVMYEINGHSSLFAFYRDIHRLMNSPSPSTYEDTRVEFGHVGLNAYNFLMKNDLRYTNAPPSMSEEHFARQLEEIERGEQPSSEVNAQ